MFGASNLSVTASALSVGLIFSACFGVLTIASMLGIGVSLLVTLSSFFVGMHSTVGGVFVALVWGFLVGGCLGYAHARLYNLIAR